MYKLYFVPEACSLATQVVLRELNQAVQIINKKDVANFERINPVGTVPVLEDGESIVREGAAIMLHILEKHDNILFPSQQDQRSLAIQNILFANATMHPAYSKLFFIAQTLPDGEAKTIAFEAATKSINDLWNVVNQRLLNQKYIGGKNLSAADIMLAVYSRWGAHFPVEIQLGSRTEEMINSVLERPSFITSLNAEQELKEAA